MPAPPAVELRDLRKSYGPVVALDGLGMTLPAGQITAVLGPNGAGKTTTLDICSGFRRPDSGSVRVLGLDPVAMTAADRARIGIMLQSGGIWSTARPGEVIRHLAGLFRDPLDPAELIARLDLQGCLRTPFRRLSGGEQQRTKLACALVGRPDLLFLDEPTAGLDPHARASVWELIGQQRDAGVTVVLSTHLLDEAQRLCDQVRVIHAGRLLAAGTPEQIVEAAGPRTPGGPASLEDAYLALTRAPGGPGIPTRRAES